MKKKVLLSVLTCTLILGFVNLSNSTEKISRELIQITKYLDIDVTVGHPDGDVLVEIKTYTSGNVVVYNSSNQVLDSFNAPYSGIYLSYLGVLPSGTYKVILYSGSTILQTKYFYI